MNTGYFSPTTVYGDTTPEGASTLYVPSDCEASLRVTSYVSGSAVFDLISTAPNPGNGAHAVGGVLGSCTTTQYPQTCTFTAPIAAGTILSIRLSVPLAQDATFYTTFVCNAASN
jgi:hypothetical protein